jgi:hypothetical protein
MPTKEQIEEKAQNMFTATEKRFGWNDLCGATKGAWRRRAAAEFGISGKEKTRNVRGALGNVALPRLRKK